MFKLKWNVKRYLLPCITIVIALLLGMSYIFPNKVLDTYTMNMEAEESLLPLEEGSSITYTMHSGTRPLRGIQPGISKQGGSFETGKLLYRVYDSKNQVLSDNSYEIREGTELQFVYLPFSDYEKCIGDIKIEFVFEAEGNTKDIPAFLINTHRREGTKTIKNQEEIEGGLKGYYVYTHDTYPFTYDLKILFFVILAMTATIPLLPKKGGIADV